MTQYSYSRIDLWHRCPYHYRLRYIEHLHEITRLDADNPLIVGHALHKGIESGMTAMRSEYINAFPVLTDAIVNELTKLEIMLPKVQEYLSQFAGCKLEHEVEIVGPDFIGFADLIITAPDGTSMVMDFKYSNSVDNYMKSGQLHLYKYYLDHAGYKVSRLQYLFIHKTAIRQKKSESLFDFRKRLVKTVGNMTVEPVTVPYDEMEVVYFQNAIREIETATEYPKNPQGDCFACNPRFAPEYLDALQSIKYTEWPYAEFDEQAVKYYKDNKNKEIELMPIPKNVRRQKKADLMPDTWLYADSYVGKTVFWDSFPDVLMLNTDGNTDNVTSPVDLIKDTVTKEGRMTKRKFAWEQFLEDVTDLEAGNPEGYKTVVLDLVEDLYEQCRQYVMDKNGWEHESDGSYGKGWSMVTTEFHNAIKRLKAVGLQIVYISREEKKDITLRGGQTRTTFRPNISEKVANFLTGTVDITMRAYVNEEDKHVLQLQKAPNTFGGGRFEFKEKEIPLERDEFLGALAEAQPVGSDRDEKAKKVVAKIEAESEPESEVEEPEEKPKHRTRKPRKAKPAEEPAAVEESETDSDDDLTPPGEEPEKPKRRQRKARVESDEEAALKAEAETTPGVAEPAKPVRRRRRRMEE